MLCHEVSCTAVENLAFEQTHFYEFGEHFWRRTKIPFPFPFERLPRSLGNEKNLTLATSALTFKIHAHRAGEGTIFAKTITTLSSETAMTDFPTRNSVLQRPKNWKEKTKLEFLSLTTEKQLALRNMHSCSF